MESGFIILIAAVALVVGVVIGMLIAKAFKRPDETQGIIYAYCSDQDTRPSLLLEYSVPIDDITLRKHVLFDVVVVRQNSHE